MAAKWGARKPLFYEFGCLVHKQKRFSIWIPNLEPQTSHVDKKTAEISAFRRFNLGGLALLLTSL